jgi:hypothetical protein
MAFVAPRSDEVVTLDLAARESDMNQKNNACSRANSPYWNASMQLSNWMECQINGNQGPGSAFYTCDRDTTQQLQSGVLQVTPYN